jgi:hypothetical protein
MVVANNEFDNDKKYNSIAGKFEHHVDAAVQCGTQHPMENILGFT